MEQFNGSFIHPEDDFIAILVETRPAFILTELMNRLSGHAIFAGEI